MFPLVPYRKQKLPCELNMIDCVFNIDCRDVMMQIGLITLNGPTL